MHLFHSENFFVTYMVCGLILDHSLNLISDHFLVWE